MVQGRRPLGAALALALSACGAGMDTATTDESTALGEAGSASSSAQQALRVADTLFELDPTLDPALSAMANANAVADHARMQLNGCGMVSVSGATVTVNFGAPPGCTTVNGLQVSGSVSVAVSGGGGSVTATVTLTNVVAGGSALAGTVSVQSSNGTSYTVNLQLTGSSNAAMGTLTLNATPTQWTLNGPLSTTRSGTTTQMTLNSVTYHPGDCYPNGGSVTLARGPVTLTETFSAGTASSGQVTVTQGRRTYTSTLPAYGSCPR